MTSDLELLRLLEEETRLRAQDEMLAFAAYVRPHYTASWHHVRLCEKLDRFARGEITRLMVFMPPRHGKSELVSRCLPAYLLGRDPDVGIIAVSYSAQLASRMNRDVQRIIDSNEYREVFPDTRLNESNVRTISGAWMRNSDIFEVVGRRGSYRSAGVGGGVTGMGANFILIDDPIKNQEQAESIQWREKVWDFYTSTLYTRLDTAHAGILVTLTRWHEDDLAGRLLLQMKNDPEADQWEIISFPAIKDVDDEDDPRALGEVLWPDRFPLSMIEKNKANGEYFFNALFQQRPAPLEGGLIKKDRLRYFRSWPKVDRIIFSWDLTFTSTGSSYYVGTAWGTSTEHPQRKYLLDRIRRRGDFVQQIADIERMIEDFPKASALYIENAANGAAAISTLRQTVKKPPIIGVKPDKSKEARLQAVLPEFEAGNVFLPDRALAPWVDEYVQELCTFPNAAHDDQVDSTTMALAKLATETNEPVTLNLAVGRKPKAGFNPTVTTVDLRLR